MVAALLSVKQFQAAADPLRRSATSVGPGGSSLQVQQMQEQLEAAHAKCAQLKQENEQLAAAQFEDRKKHGAANNGGSAAAAAGRGAPVGHSQRVSSFESANAAVPNTPATGFRLLVSMPPLTKPEAARLGEEGRRLRVAAEMERAGVVRSRAAIVRVAWNFKESKKGARGYDVYFVHLASENDASYALSRASQSRMAVWLEGSERPVIGQPSSSKKHQKNRGEKRSWNHQQPPASTRRRQSEQGRYKRQKFAVAALPQPVAAAAAASAPPVAAAGFTYQLVPMHGQHLQQQPPPQMFQPAPPVQYAAAAFAPAPVYGPPVYAPPLQAQPAFYSPVAPPQYPFQHPQGAAAAAAFYQPRPQYY
jgi:hypothetical protein